MPPYENFPSGSMAGRRPISGYRQVKSTLLWHRFHAKRLRTSNSRKRKFGISPSTKERH